MLVTVTITLVVWLILGLLVGVVLGAMVPATDEEGCDTADPEGARRANANSPGYGT